MSFFTGLQPAKATALFVVILHWRYHQPEDPLFYNPDDRGALKMNECTEIDYDGEAEGRGGSQ